jgi:3-oxoacyl-[acyl-carrier-protein] synthase II
MAMLAVSGWSALCSAGIGVDAFTSAVTDPALGDASRPAPTVTGLFDEPLPDPAAHALVDFNVRDHLGRKGTSLFDRWTSFSVVTCGLALSDGGVQLDTRPRERVGIVLGTTAGGLKSTSDFSRDTLVQEKPYLVQPSLFPNTVMNCGAGQSAIWYGLKGVNATVAGGQLAFLQALRYAATSLGRGYVDTLLTGAVEEFSPHVAWATRLVTAVPPGEGAAVFVVERDGEARAAGRPVDAEILAVSTGFCPGPRDDAALVSALAGCIRTALTRAGVPAHEVSLAATGDADAGVETAALAEATPGASVRLLPVKRWFGECQAASGALQLAAILALHRAEPARDGGISVLTGHTADGGVGACVIRGWSRGADHG